MKALIYVRAVINFIVLFLSVSHVYSTNLLMKVGTFMKNFQELA